MKLFQIACLPLLVLFSGSLHAQYYYKDIIGTAETNRLFQNYITHHVTSVSLKSYEPDGSSSQNFVGEQSVNSAERILHTTTSSGVTDKTSLTAWYNANNRLQRTVDTSGNTTNTALYTYDSDGKLLSVKSFAGDTLNSHETEEHQWFYTDNNQPLQMLRIINNKDSSLIRFRLDENGNVSEEIVYKKEKAGDPVYYYYNDRNQLTDIVRYNYKLKKLLPDYMFEYSPAGQVIQKITVPSNKASAYLIWRYQYDNKGLKTREACFTKNKQLAGKVEYHYRFE